jgi:hypothetical protein
MPTTYPIIKGNQYMDTTLYTGNGATQSIVNAGGFSPDLFWGKSRSLSYSNNLTDSVRGVGKELLSDSTSAEQNNGGVTSFNSNGVTLSSWGGYNQSSATYVGWQWRASDSAPVTNTAGSITSTVSANTTAGFSIVTYTGTGVNATVGHGLSSAPKMVIVKERSNANAWYVYNQNIGSGNALILNTTDSSSATGAWNSTAPTSSVFSLGNITQVNGSGRTYVAYCWAEVPGFSKFGSYVGNGNADGTFVYTGFRPAFIMCKRTDSTGFWAMLDDVRGPFNVVDEALYANSTNVESTAQNVDFLSNGFKFRSTDSDTNSNGGTHIYMAFAEMPTTYANAR